MYGGNSKELLTTFPPDLIFSKGCYEPLIRTISPDRKFTAFEYIPWGDRNGILGVVDLENKILWQKTIPKKCLSSCFWSNDGKYLVFYCNPSYHYSSDSIDLMPNKILPKSETGDSVNFLYVLNASDGETVYSFDPDISIFGFSKIADPILKGYNLSGGGCVRNVVLDRNIMTVTMDFYASMSGNKPANVPDWLLKPFVGKIIIPGIK